jgi:hypothetical protein
MRPTASEWTQAVAGSIVWEDMNWPQSMFSTDWGMRSVCLEMETWMSIVPSSQPDVSVQEHSIPFFRAASFNYRLKKP